MKSTSLSLVFYCPSTVLGGTEILFSRLIKRCINDERISQVNIIDISGGVLTSLIGDQSPVNVFNADEDIEIENVILITPAKCLHTLYELLNKNNIKAKLCVWQLGSGGLSENLVLPLWFKFGMSKTVYKIYRQGVDVILFGIIKKARKFVLNLVDKQAIFFTDFVGAKQTFIDLDIENIDLQTLSILPVFVDDSKQEYTIQNTNKLNELHVGWLGRISSDFKIHSLLHSINQIISYSSGKNINVVFHIVGDGDAMHNLKQAITLIAKRKANVKFFLYGLMDNTAAIQLFLKKVDVAISMGTSALDVAKKGIPTIIVSPVTSKKKYSKIKFRWLSNSIGYSLGEFPNDFDLKHIESSLPSLLDEFFIDWKKISFKTYHFVNNGFTIGVAHENFLRYIQDCEYTGINFIEQFETFYYLRKNIKKISKIYRPKWLPN